MWKQQGYIQFYIQTQVKNCCYALWRATPARFVLFPHFQILQRSLSKVHCKDLYSMGTKKGMSKTISNAVFTRGLNANLIIFQLQLSVQP